MPGVKQDSILIEVRYALTQLNGCIAPDRSRGQMADRVQRAIDALERIEEALTNEEEG